MSFGQAERDEGEDNRNDERGDGYRLLDKPALEIVLFITHTRSMGDEAIRICWSFYEIPPPAATAGNKTIARTVEDVNRLQQKHSLQEPDTSIQSNATPTTA